MQLGEGPTKRGHCDVGNTEVLCTGMTPQPMVDCGVGSVNGILTVCNRPGMPAVHVRRRCAVSAVHV